MTEQQPDVSIIISTKNRAEAIGPCIESIVHSIQHAGVVGEIVVVDNASTDGTAEELRKRALGSTVPLKPVYESKSGTSAARNAGIAAASGRLLVFTDDDCRLSTTYIAEAIKYDTADGPEAVFRSGSVVLGDTDDLPITIKLVTERRAWQRPMDLTSEAQILGKSLIGCNMFLRRSTLEMIGRFDERLGPGTACRASEDTDYFYRAYLKGVRLEIVPDMVISHFHGRKAESDRTRLLVNYSFGNGALAMKYLFVYPNFSRHLYWMLKKPNGDKDFRWLPKKAMAAAQIEGACLYACAVIFRRG